MAAVALLLIVLGAALIYAGMTGDSLVAAAQGVLSGKGGGGG